MAQNSTLKSISSKVSRVTNMRVPSVIEDFNISVTEPIHGTTPVMKVQTDVYMLFNQQRLDKMTTEALINYLSNYTAHDDGLAAIRNKLSDAQLSQFVKSRYIQSPSELKAWSSYLMSNYDQVVADLNDQIAQQQAKEAAKQQAQQAQQTQNFASPAE